jgi:hypothetical protein
MTVALILFPPDAIDRIKHRRIGSTPDRGAGHRRGDGD